MVSFDFLTKPICLSKDKINVLYIENQQVFRNTIRKFYDGVVDENNIIFSENYNPVRFKNNVCFIPDIFCVDYSSSFLKRVYEDLSDYANTYLQESTVSIKANIIDFLEKLSQNYDLDFDFKDEVDITDLLKIQSFKPNLNNDNLLSRLLDYIIMMRRYSSITCFVILNLHTYFSLTELELFYKELAYQSIEILVIENKKVFNSLQNEITYIVDEDMCEIIEN